MNSRKVLSVFVVASSVLFIVLQTLGQEYHAFVVKALAMVILLILYTVSVGEKNVFFLLFIITYTVADIYNVLTYNIFPAKGVTIDVHYLVGNSLYILSYIFLILKVSALIDFKGIFVKFPYQLTLLFALDIFVVWVLTDLVRLTLGANYAYIIELLYNLTIMILVSLSLINYMQNDTKKAMNLLLGCICIMFSEVIQIAYYYVSSLNNTLSIVYSVLLVLAFFFFFKQSQLYRSFNALITNRQTSDF